MYDGDEVFLMKMQLGEEGGRRGWLVLVKEGGIGTSGWTRRRSERKETKELKMETKVEERATE